VINTCRTKIVSFDVFIGQVNCRHGRAREDLCYHLISIHAKKYCSWLAKIMCLPLRETSWDFDLTLADSTSPPPWGTLSDQYISYSHSLYPQWWFQWTRKNKFCYIITQNHRKIKQRTCNYTQGLFQLYMFWCSRIRHSKFYQMMRWKNCQENVEEEKKDVTEVNIDFTDEIESEFYGF
jgi:hypothetical protein